MKLNKTKKGEIYFFIIRILILTMSFIILIMFLTKFNSKTSNQANIIACSAFLKSLGNVNKYDPGILKLEINKRCKVNNYIINTDNKKTEIYEELKNSMFDAWREYGKGEIDFVSNFNVKNQHYCFLSGKIKFKGPVKKFKYVNFSNYLFTKAMVKENNKKIKFSEAVNFLYLNVTDKNLNEVSNNIDNVKKLIKDKTTKDIGFFILDQQIFFNNLVYKEIDTSKVYYVVYVYTKTNKKIVDEFKDGLVAAIGAQVAYMVAETIAIGLITSGLGLFAKLGDLFEIVSYSRKALYIKRAFEALSIIGRTIRFSLRVVAVGGAATMGVAYNDNPTLQYVDLMSPEEYYRLCG